ncbi:MAG: ATPase [Cellvibrionales bacterium]|nr:ATPase [Cellvibrionales bacterium]
MRQNQPLYYLGIDGGGSKCRAIIQNTEGETLGEGLSGTANPAYGIQAAQQSIVEATYSALSNANLPSSTINQLIAGAGLAGVDIQRFLKAMQDWQHPFRAWFVTHDLPIACLGAHQQSDGAVIITGTGSSGYARVNNKEIWLGGYGFPHGDQASGAWLGLNALNAIFLANDNLGPKTHLTEAIAQQLKITTTNEALADWFVGKSSRVYASLAPIIIAEYQQDSVATAIINEAIDYLKQLGSELLATSPIALALIGGLSHFYYDHLKPTFEHRLIRPKNNPEQGAIVFALQEYKQTNKEKKQ